VSRSAASASGGPWPALSLLVPTWNGRPLLERNLPPLLAAARAYRESTGQAAEVVVVDDGSSDDTRAFLAVLAQTGLRPVFRERNGGFASACNTGFGAARHPVIVLLNNDVTPRPGFLIPLAGHFRDPSVFAATCRVLLPETDILSTGGKLGLFRKGFWSVHFNFEPRPEAPPGEVFPSITAIGGFTALDRAKLMELGGFREIFNPCFWEDNDLSYRAWRRGWRIVYEPRSEVYHQPSSTIGKAFRRRRIETLSTRNRLLFHRLHLRDARFWAPHLGMLALLLASQWAARPWFYPAFWQALRRLPEIRRLRRQEGGPAVRSDRDIAAVFHSLLARPDLEIIRSHEDAVRWSAHRSGSKPDQK